MMISWIDDEDRMVLACFCAFPTLLLHFPSPTGQTTKIQAMKSGRESGVCEKKGRSTGNYFDKAFSDSVFTSCDLDGLSVAKWGFPPHVERGALRGVIARSA